MNHETKRLPPSSLANPRHRYGFEEETPLGGRLASRTARRQAVTDDVDNLRGQESQRTYLKSPAQRALLTPRPFGLSN